MALRYLTRKVSIPALRQASGPRVSPPGGARPLNSSASQGGAKGSGKEIDDDVARVKAAFEAQREAFRKFVREEQRARRMIIGSGAAGLGVAALVVEYGS